MLDEGNDLNLDTTETPPEESGNRTFLIVGGIMAALVFLTLVCMAVYLFVIRPGQTAKTEATQTAVAMMNQQDIQLMTSTAEAALWTPTLENTNTPQPSNTPAPLVATNTPVVAVEGDMTETPTSDPATLEAMQTELAVQMTSTAAFAAGTRAIGGEGTPDPGMPTTGFFDEVGLPMLIILTAALLAVIFVARRLRHAPTK